MKRSKNFWNSSLGLFSVVLSTFLLGWNLGYRGVRFQIPFSGGGIIDVGGLQGEWSLLNQVVDLLNNKYQNSSEIEEKDLISGAIKGAVNSVGDPYTVYYTAEEYELFEKSMEGSYEGVGIQLGFREGNLVVVTPLYNSPAMRAGVREGDIILKVDNQLVSDKSLTEVATLIRGEENSEVSLTVLRSSSEMEEKTFPIIREKINLPSLTLWWEEDIAVVSFFRFGEDVAEVWSQAEEEILGRGAKGLVIDFRNNPGGYLEGAIRVAESFFSEGIIVSRKYGDSRIENIEVSNRGNLIEIPVVAIINQGSASASEIVAGALQSRNRGVLVGETSFGKGTVQEAIPLSGGANLHVTVSKWLLPNGQEIDQQGLTPDELIEITEEEISQGQDPQMDRALILVKE